MKLNVLEPNPSIYNWEKTRNNFCLFSTFFKSMWSEVCFVVGQPID